jgi:hypothetical protein
LVHAKREDQSDQRRKLAFPARVAAGVQQLHDHLMLRAAPDIDKSPTLISIIT